MLGCNSKGYNLFNLRKMIGYIITISILAIFLSLSLFGNWNLIKKNEKAEDMIISRDKIIKNFIETINFSNERLKQIDAAGTFKSDDEVGFFFKQIKALQEMLNQFYINSNGHS